MNHREGHESLLEAGYEPTGTYVNGFELYELNDGRCVLYDNRTDDVRPFIEQAEFDAEG